MTSENESTNPNSPISPNAEKGSVAHETTVAAKKPNQEVARLSQFMAKLNRNKFFKFISSIRLAVPVMLVLIVSVAVGTIYESLYNSEYAKLVVYGSKWFLGVLIVLWLNIFCATISRIPFKKHHTGFVITHIGLLTLLIGGMMTSLWGIDGQLRILEGEKSNTVVLPSLMVGVQTASTGSLQKFQLQKSISVESAGAFSHINDITGSLFRIEKYLPFVESEDSYQPRPGLSNDVAVSFFLRSDFFNVTEWLHSSEKPELKMGPATIRLHRRQTGKLVTKNSDFVTEKQGLGKKKVASKKMDEAVSSAQVIVRDKSTQGILATIPLEKFKKSGFGAKDLKIQFSQSFKRAVVSENKIVEGPNQGNLNPALEIFAMKGGQKLRDIVYARFPGFSLQKEGLFGVEVIYSVAENANERVGSEEVTADGTGTRSGATEQGAAQVQPAAGEGNFIDFYVEEGKDSSLVVLSKNGEIVGQQELLSGQTFQTPWMGARVILGSVIRNAVATNQVRETPPQKGAELPPAAILVKAQGDSSDAVWIREDEGRSFEAFQSRPAFSVLFGRETISLPFSLQLMKFTKRDYPGTETPMSYESVVKTDTGFETLISMNEPLHHQGFTIYQSSYILNPGEKPVSIFSVNQDPGRSVKYLGSIILSLGIIIFTLMRSRLYKTRVAVGSKK